jgi:hypothetical protein
MWFCVPSAGNAPHKTRRWFSMKTFFFRWHQISAACIYDVTAPDLSKICCKQFIWFIPINSYLAVQFRCYIDVAFTDLLGNICKLRCPVYVAVNSTLLSRPGHPKYAVSNTFGLFPPIAILQFNSAAILTWHLQIYWGMTVSSAALFYVTVTSCCTLVTLTAIISAYV